MQQGEAEEEGALSTLMQMINIRFVLLEAAADLVHILGEGQVVVGLGPTSLLLAALLARHLWLVLVMAGTAREKVEAAAVG